MQKNMIGNHEGFIYIKNDEDVILKTSDVDEEVYTNLKEENSKLRKIKKKIPIKEKINGAEINPENIEMENNLSISQGDIINLHREYSDKFRKYPEEKNEEFLLLKEKSFTSAGGFYDDRPGPKIINLDQVPLYRQVFIAVHPFIVNGYRIHHTAKDCFISMFTLHNETMNIWTHFMPFISCIILMIFLVTSENIDSKIGAFLYVYVFFTMLLFLFSTIYHTFSCHSLEVGNCCFKLDLFGIMLGLISGTISSLFFMFHDFETTRKTYIYLYLILGVTTIIMSLFDYFISMKLNNFLMLLYASLFGITFLSFLHWVCIANLQEVKIISIYALFAFLTIFIGFVFFFAKFPESYYHNYYIDHFFHSHSIWHLCTTLALLLYFIMLYEYYTILYNFYKNQNKVN